MLMLISFETPNLVREISRKTGLIVSSHYFFESAKEPGVLSVSFYLANADDQEVVYVRFKAVLNDARVSFKEVYSVTVGSSSSSPWFEQVTKITITDDNKENYPVIANMVAKLFKAK